MQKLATFWLWYKQTSTLLGLPVLMILLFMGFQKVLFTTTCQTAGDKCEYSIGATDAMAEYMGALLASNENMDIVTTPRKKK